MKTEAKVFNEGVRLPKDEEPQERHPSEHLCGKAGRGRDCPCWTCARGLCRACLEALL